MTRYLMISDADYHCWNCGNVDGQDPNDMLPMFCPSCQYAYWSDDEIAANPDNAHFTGMSEQAAREDKEYAEAVASADSY